MSGYGTDAAWQEKLKERLSEVAIERNDLVARVAALEAERAKLEADLRREWWLNHGCDYHALYGDDGEMWCSGSTHHALDFKRQPIDELRDAVFKARLARAALVSGEDK